MWVNLKTLVVNALLASSSFWWLQGFLECGHISPASASKVTLMPLLSYVSLFHMALCFKPPLLISFLKNLNVFIFNWGIIPWQYCASLCTISTWIIHRYTYVSLLLSLLPRVIAFRGFPGGSAVKESTCPCRRCRRTGSIPGSERSPGGGNGKPLQYFCLGNPMSVWGHKALDMTVWLSTDAWRKQAGTD